MQVKICGIRAPEHLLNAAANGADMVGLVFAPSRRQVDVAQAQMLVRMLRDAGYATKVAGLFVDAPSATIATTMAACQLDVVQLHGAEPVTIIAELPTVPILRAIRFDGSETEQAWLTLNHPQVTLLVDAPATADLKGGTGHQADWHQAAQLARTQRIILAGGLTPANVASAIAAVQPWGVDVSSGVERDGIKDNGKIAAFIHLAKQHNEVA
jgi:phosphoribosylanthranilate isomerase